MKANCAKQTETLQQQNQAMQNKIIHLERQAQQNGIQPRGQGGLDRPKQPQHDQEQKVPNPLEADSVVKEEPLPWCNPCDLPHKQEPYLFAQQAARLASETYNDGPINSINYVGDFCDEINIVSNSPNEQIKEAKEKEKDQATISRALAPKPTHEEIKRRIQEKD